jgi:hypothetical protein
MITRNKKYQVKLWSLKAPKSKVKLANTSKTKGKLFQKQLEKSLRRNKFSKSMLRI